MEKKQRRGFGAMLKATKEMSWTDLGGGYEESLEKLRSETIRDMATPVLWTTEELYERKLIFSGMQQREVLNAFRELKVRLLQKSQSDNIITLITSLSGHGGASFVAMNLAIAFALDTYKTALYVDCNPYDSSANRLAVEPMEYGLTDYLKDGTLDISDIIYPTGIERLRVIPAGSMRDSAAEQFNSARMRDMIDEIKNRYQDRFVILDAPTIQDSTEVRILSKYCDSAVLVIPFGKVLPNQVMSAVDVVGKDRFAGLMFNYN